MKKKYIHTIVILNLLLACSRQAGTDKLVPGDADHVKFIDISTPHEILKVEKFFKLEKLILLKSDSAAAFIQGIDKVLYFKKKFLVVDKQAPAVSFFDSHGNFIKNLISMGNGPGEFTHVADVLIDSESNAILIYSLNDFKMAWFNENGKLLRERRVKFTAHGMNWLSYPYLIFTTNYLYRADDGKNYACLVADTSGRMIGHYLQHPDCDAALAFSGINIAADSGKPFIAESLSDTVFQADYLSAEKPLVLSPFAVFSFGKRSLPAINSRCNFYVERENTFIADYDNLENAAFSTQPYFFFSFCKKRYTRWGIISNRTDSVFLNNPDYDEDYCSILKSGANLQLYNLLNQPYQIAWLQFILLLQMKPSIILI